MGDFSVVILTQNEEQTLPACLQSCVGIADVHVVDSGSTDETVRIARAHGAEVHVHPFASFGAQRNWVIENVPLKHPWVLHLDADERLTPALQLELRTLVDTEPTHAGYRVASKLLFMNRWIRYADDYPKYQVRFFHVERLRFVDHGHGQRESTAGTLGTVTEAYLHDAFAKGIEHWLDKHNRYSTLEAEAALRGGTGRPPISHLVSRDSTVRRRALKQAAIGVPFRAELRWLYMAILRRGFLDGRPGLAYVSLMVTYERMISHKVAWLTSQGQIFDSTDSVD